MRRKGNGINNVKDFSHRCRSISSSNGSKVVDVTAVSSPCCRRVVMGISSVLSSPENNCCSVDKDFDE